MQKKMCDAMREYGEGLKKKKERREQSWGVWNVNGDTKRLLVVKSKAGGGKVCKDP